MGLEIAEFMIAVEDTFQVEIFEGEIQGIETLDDLVAWLAKNLATNGRLWSRESIEKEVLQLVSKNSWVPVEKISLSKKIVDVF